MLTDDEAKGIAESCHSGAEVHQPLMVRWIDALLADRRERIEHASYVRQRLRQAFDYLSQILEPKPAATQREEKHRARRAWNA
jgi:hypothetical protein